MAYYIDEDNYYKRTQPAKTEELVNLVQVPVSPLVAQDIDDRFYTGEPILFTASEEKTLEIKYSDVPMTDVTITAYISDVDGELDDDGTDGEYTNDTITITSETLYAWGASVTLTNTEATSEYIVLVAGGIHLKAKGDQIPESRDEEGIVENGILKHKLKANHLIQTNALGQDVADTLLDSFSTARKDVNLDYRGNLCLKLMQEIETITYNKDSILSTDTFYLYKIQTTFDGTLRQILDGRKIL